MTTRRDDRVPRLDDRAGAGASREQPECENTLPFDQAAGIRAAPDADGEFAMLEALGLALRGAIGTLREAAAAPGRAFRAVAVADHALAAAPEFFAALAVLVANADPAPEVAADLSRYAEQAAEINRETSPLREQLAALLQAKDRLQAEAARRDEIIAKITKLERIKRLAAHTAALRAQYDTLADRTREVAAIVTAAEEDLGQAAGALVTLTEDALGTLTERTRALLMRAAEQDRMLWGQVAGHRAAARRAVAGTERAQAELAQAEADAERALADYHSAHTQAVSRLSALRRYQSANHDIADALACRLPQTTGQNPAQADPLADALRALGEVEARLAEVDALLRAALSPGKD